MQEDKIFDLLEKLFIEVQETKKDVKEIKTDVSKLGIKMEHDVSNKIDALFEFRDITNERLERIENKIDYLTEKIETHDIKIKVIEGGNKKKESV